MRRGATFSAVLHVIIVVLAFFGLPTLLTDEEPLEQRIPVDVYTVTDETVLPPPEVDVEPEPEPVEEVAPIPPEPEVAEVFTPPPSDPVPAPPAPPEPEPEVVVAPDPAPQPPAPELTVPVVSEIPLPAPPKPTPVAKAEAAPEAKPEVKPEPQPDLFESLLASVEEAAREAPELEVASPQAEASEAAVLQTVIPKLSDQPLSLSVLDAIRRQIEDKWSLPVGAADAGGLEVEIEIVLKPDGTVLKASIVDSARLNLAGEEFFRSMAESALRAVQRASPLQNLPPEKHEQWRGITFRFRPPV
ncbi:MAG: TonB C-terminal domain-containing protein [Alphaproteobacteria bacterium]